MLFSKHNSLWADWHKHHNLRGNSFWAVKESNQNSWTWNSLLKLRPLAENFIRCTVGNGRSTSFWFDHWTPLGPIIKLLGDNGPRDLRMPLCSTVAAACNEQSWQLAAPRSDSALSLQIHLTTLQLPSSSQAADSFAWEINGKCSFDYSAAKTWDVIRTRQDEKDWVGSVWFKGAVPKHAFNFWVAHLTSRWRFGV